MGSPRPGNVPRDMPMGKHAHLVPSWPHLPRRKKTHACLQDAPRTISNVGWANRRINGERGSGQHHHHAPRGLQIREKDIEMSKLREFERQLRGWPINRRGRRQPPDKFLGHAKCNTRGPKEAQQLWKCHQRRTTSRKP